MDTQRSKIPVNGILRVREAARKDHTLRFNNLMHHITIELLESSYEALNPKAAPGVDEVTWQAYGRDMEKRLKDLHQRVQGGRYRAQPSKRIYIPKADGKQRPIGIAAMEDKIVQHAVTRARPGTPIWSHGGMAEWRVHPQIAQSRKVAQMTLGIHRWWDLRHLLNPRDLRIDRPTSSRPLP